MQRYYYAARISEFLAATPNEIVGALLTNSAGSATEHTQRDAWIEQITILRNALQCREGRIYFEFSVPRMGSRIDTILLLESALFVLEFKVGESQFTSQATNQVYDYALDLKNFHSSSRDSLIAPILISTEAKPQIRVIATTIHDDRVLIPIRSNMHELGPTIAEVLSFATAKEQTANSGDWIANWDRGRYAPTPTIVEAAVALYSNHAVADISRSDAAAVNLTVTSAAITDIIEAAKSNQFKAICFVTGVPGAGKTLVGLNIATQRREESDELYSVFLSGNEPLVKILREALTRDRVRRDKAAGLKTTKGKAMRAVKKFIQNVHHFRDECIVDQGPPCEHVALFDEAQRAWDLRETASFMKRRKRTPNFGQSEPEFLISCLNRHEDWAVIVCLVGGGQEINRGEAGIGEWIESLNRAFPDWNIYISDRLRDSEYAAGHVLEHIQHKEHVRIDERLHLSVSMRSYRAEKVSAFVKAVLDMEMETAAELYRKVKNRYPLVLTRDLTTAKQWLRYKARGTERYGLLASSSAERLKAKCINVKAP